MTSVINIAIILLSLSPSGLGTSLSPTMAAGSQSCALFTLPPIASTGEFPSMISMVNNASSMCPLFTLPPVQSMSSMTPKTPNRTTAAPTGPAAPFKPTVTSQSLTITPGPTALPCTLVPQQPHGGNKFPYCSCNGQQLPTTIRDAAIDGTVVAESETYLFRSKHRLSRAKEDTRLFRSRLAQEIVQRFDYDTEHANLSTRANTYVNMVKTYSKHSSK